MKVTDAKLTDIQKALQAANIKIRSIIELYKGEEQTLEAPKKD